MNQRQRLLPLLCLVLPLTATHARLYEPAVRDWDYSFDSFVPYPPELEAVLDTHVEPVMLDIFSEVDNGEEEFFNLIKGVVRRNKAVLASKRPVIQDGVDVGCRTVVGNNTNPETGDLETEEVVTDQCTRHCTNHGRYCSHPEDDRMWGGEHVKEAVRRMCFFFITHDQGNSLLWEYLEMFDKAGCNHYDQDRHLEQCSYEIIDQIEELSRDQMELCVQQTGGFTADKDNTALSQQLRLQEQHNVDLSAVANRRPQLEVNGKKYEGDYFSNEILAFVCEAFPGHAKPFACDFCSKCSDTRKCLWHMECDGRLPTASDFTDHIGDADIDLSGMTFSSSSAEAENVDEGANADADAAANADTDTNADAATETDDEEETSSGNKWVTAFVCGISIGLVVAAVMACFSWRGKRRIQESIRKNRVSYMDDESNMDFSSRKVDGYRDDPDSQGHGMSMRPYTSSSRVTDARNLEYSRNGSFRTLGFKGGRGMTAQSSSARSSFTAHTSAPSTQSAFAAHTSAPSTQWAFAAHSSAAPSSYTPRSRSTTQTIHFSTADDDDDDWDKEVPGIVIV